MLGVLVLVSVLDLALTAYGGTSREGNPFVRHIWARVGFFGYALARACVLGALCVAGTLGQRHPLIQGTIAVVTAATAVVCVWNGAGAIFCGRKEVQAVRDRVAEKFTPVQCEAVLCSRRSVRG